VTGECQLSTPQSDVQEQEEASERRVEERRESVCVCCVYVSSGLVHGCCFALAKPNAHRTGNNPAPATPHPHRPRDSAASSMRRKSCSHQFAASLQTPRRLTLSRVSTWPLRHGGRFVRAARLRVFLCRLHAAGAGALDYVFPKREVHRPQDDGFV